MPVMMEGLIAALGGVGLICLGLESAGLRRARSRLEHVVHVNGTRGKSTVSRLIEAGLRAGGLRVFCKTTGTDPMTIDVSGAERLIRRRGKANIKEQIGIVRQAAAQGAQVLVVECMAVQPELQNTAQHRILTADVGVITNVRRDHTDVMGNSLPQIARALANTVPKGGVLFTADEGAAPYLRQRAQALGSEFHLVRPDGTEPEGGFAENTALALAVCAYLGVDRETALAGMARYRPDPYALSVHRLGGGVFVNGLSINDIQSIGMVKERVWAQYALDGRGLVLLINNRADRGSRTRDMLEVCLGLKPEEVWLLGASQWYMGRRLARLLPGTRVRRWHTAAQLPLGRLEGRVVYAIGNIAQQGREIMARVREEGEALV